MFRNQKEERSWMLLFTVLVLVLAALACGGEVSSTEVGEVASPATEKQAVKAETIAPTLALETQIITHTVQSGETLNNIANKYGVTVETLIELNNIENPDIIQAGQVLTISVRTVSTPLPISSVPSPTPTETPGPVCTAIQFGEFLNDTCELVLQVGTEFSEISEIYALFDCPGIWDRGRMTSEWYYNGQL